MAEVPHSAPRRDRFADDDASRSVGDVHAVEVEHDTLVGSEETVTPTLVEGLYPALHGYEPNDP